MTRTCTTCGFEKPVGSFGPRARAKSGYTSSCRECVAKQARAYRLANPEAVRATVQRRADRKRG